MRPVNDLARDGIHMTRVVAFGGGHGLAATLRALASLSDDVNDEESADENDEQVAITAVVTVADDGGSSGRLRAERGCLPPGDLRQALAALAGPVPRAAMVARLFQHRFTPRPPGADRTVGTRPQPDWLAGHAVGNLILCGLLDLYPDPVAALDAAAAMIDARGRVLPMSPVPLRIEADLRDDLGQLRTVSGQRAVAISPGTVEAVRIGPPEPPACAEAIEAAHQADWLIFGPGSWYTSVIPHLLVPDLAKAIQDSPARRLVILNLAVEKETAGLSLAGHLDALTRYLPGLRVDVVLADRDAIGDPAPVERAAQSLGARLAVSPMAVGDGTPRHHPVAVATALRTVLVDGAVGGAAERTTRRR
jgi:uncharacterized cofD-like protein